MRFVEQNNDLLPDTWKGGKGEGIKTAMYKCPNGHIASLSNHDILEYGSVVPSVVCPTDDCDFHEFIKLVGWIP